MRPKAETPDPDAVTQRNPGFVERAVSEQLAATPDHGKPGLAASALMLARQLDDGAGLATAAVARELRATLTDIARTDEEADGGAIGDLLARLSSPVRDSA